MKPTPKNLEAYLEQNISTLVARGGRSSRARLKEPVDAKKMKSHAVKMQNLRKNELHLTQEELASVLGLNLRSLQDWENGRHAYPRPVELLLLLMSEIPAVRKRLTENVLKR